MGGTGASGVDCERLDVSLGLEPFTLPGEEEVRVNMTSPPFARLREKKRRVKMGRRLEEEGMRKMGGSKRKIRER